MRADEDEEERIQRVYGPPQASPETMAVVLEIARTLVNEQRSLNDETIAKIREEINRLPPDSRVNQEQAEAILFSLWRVVEFGGRDSRENLFQQVLESLQSPAATLKVFLINWWARYLTFYLMSLKDKDYRKNFAAYDQQWLQSFADAIDAELGDIFAFGVESGDFAPTRWDKMPGWIRAIFWLSSPFVFLILWFMKFFKNFFKPPQTKGPGGLLLHVAINEFFIPAGSLLLLTPPHKPPYHFNPVLFEAADPEGVIRIKSEHPAAKGWVLFGQPVIHAGFRSHYFHASDSRIIVINWNQTFLEAAHLAAFLTDDPASAAQRGFNVETWRQLWEQRTRLFSGKIRQKGWLPPGIRQESLDRIDQLALHLLQKAFGDYFKPDSKENPIQMIRTILVNLFVNHEISHRIFHGLGFPKEKPPRYSKEELEVAAHLMEFLSPRVRPETLYYSLYDHLVLIAAPSLSDEPPGDLSSLPGNYSEIPKGIAHLFDALIGTRGTSQIASQKTPAGRIQALAGALAGLELEALDPQEIQRRIRTALPEKFSEALVAIVNQVSSIINSVKPEDFSTPLKERILSEKDNLPYAAFSEPPPKERAEVRGKRKGRKEDSEKPELTTEERHKKINEFFAKIETLLAAGEIQSLFPPLRYIPDSKKVRGLLKLLARETGISTGTLSSIFRRQAGLKKEMDRIKEAIERQWIAQEEEGPNPEFSPWFEGEAGVLQDLIGKHWANLALIARDQELQAAYRKAGVHEEIDWAFIYERVLRKASLQDFYKKRMKDWEGNPDWPHAPPDSRRESHRLVQAFLAENRSEPARGLKDTLEKLRSLLPELMRIKTRLSLGPADWQLSLSKKEIEALFSSLNINPGELKLLPKGNRLLSFISGLPSWLTIKKGEKTDPFPPDPMVPINDWAFLELVVRLNWGKRLDTSAFAELMTSLGYPLDPFVAKKWILTIPILRPPSQGSQKIKKGSPRVRRMSIDPGRGPRAEVRSEDLEKVRKFIAHYRSEMDDPELKARVFAATEIAEVLRDTTSYELHSGLLESHRKDLERAAEIFMEAWDAGERSEEISMLLYDLATFGTAVPETQAVLRWYLRHPRKNPQTSLLASRAILQSVLLRFSKSFDAELLTDLGALLDIKDEKIDWNMLSLLNNFIEEPHLAQSIKIIKEIPSWIKGIKRVARSSRYRMSRERAERLLRYFDEKIPKSKGPPRYENPPWRVPFFQTQDEAILQEIQEHAIPPLELLKKLFEQEGKRMVFLSGASGFYRFFSEYGRVIHELGKLKIARIAIPVPDRFREEMNAIRKGQTLLLDALERVEQGLSAVEDEEFLKAIMTIMNSEALLDPEFEKLKGPGAISENDQDEILRFEDWIAAMDPDIEFYLYGTEESNMILARNEVVRKLLPLAKDIEKKTLVLGWVGTQLDGVASQINPS